MSCYIHHGFGEEALRIFYNMNREGISPNRSTFLSAIASCSLVMALTEGETIHSHVVELCFDSESLICSALLKMYVKCGDVENARDVLNRMHVCDVISWTSMMVSYIQHGNIHEACKLFREMMTRDVNPDEISFGTILGACESPLYLQEGRVIHATIIENGCKLDDILGTALIDMYTKCGNLNDGLSVFYAMDHKDVVCWTTMMMAFVDCNYKAEALYLYNTMQYQGIFPNEVTVIALSGLCDCPDSLYIVKIIHIMATDSGLFRLNVMVRTALINMYGKCGACELARRVFDEKEEEDDLVLWNAIITTYTQQGEGTRALELFDCLKCRGMEPDQITFSGLLGACSDLTQGKAIHTVVLETIFASNTVVGNALVNMYSKCGSMQDTCIAFESVSNRDVISWNAFVASHCRHGYGDLVLQVLKNMEEDGVKPDDVTFLCLISACSHAGRPQEGYYLYMLMSKDYNILPHLGHYCCMVDMLGRVGYLDDAENMINEMPFEPDYVIYTTLLNACKMHDDVVRGERIAKLVFSMDTPNSESYILLSNIYATHKDYHDNDIFEFDCDQFQTPGFVQ